MTGSWWPWALLAVWTAALLVWDTTVRRRWSRTQHWMVQLQDWADELVDRGCDMLEREQRWVRSIHPSACKSLADCARKSHELAQATSELAQRRPRPGWDR